MSDFDSEFSVVELNGEMQGQLAYLFDEDVVLDLSDTMDGYCVSDTML